MGWYQNQKVRLQPSKEINVVKHWLRTFLVLNATFISANVLWEQKKSRVSIQRSPLEFVNLGKLQLLLFISWTSIQILFYSLCLYIPDGKKGAKLTSTGFSLDYVTKAFFFFDSLSKCISISAFRQSIIPHYLLEANKNDIFKYLHILLKRNQKQIITFLRMTKSTNRINCNSP